MSIIIEFNDQQYLINSFADGAFKKLKTEGDSGGGMSVHNPSHNPSSSCPTPARRRHRTTFTQVSFQTITRDVLFEFHLKFWNKASIGIPASSLLKGRQTSIWSNCSTKRNNYSMVFK